MILQIGRIGMGLLLLLLLNAMHSCKPKQVVYHQYYNKNAKDIDNGMDSQRALALWLKSQPQEVRDAFKRDFLFSEEEIKNLTDSLRK